VRGAFVLFFLLLSALTVPAAEPSKRPNIILIVLDTVRYDAISRANTPFLDSLAKSGVVFTSAYSTHDFTPTSHFSMETGFRDGLGTDDDRPENGVAWQLRRNGYFTFAVAANGLLGPTQMPIHRAFQDFYLVGDIASEKPLNLEIDLLSVDARLQLFHVSRSSYTRAMAYYSADRVLPPFLERMRTAKAPYFGFVNLIDAHEPYVPHARTYQPETNLPRNFEGAILGRRLSPQLAHPDSIADPAIRAQVKSKIAEVGLAHLLAFDLPPESLAIYKRRYMAKVRETDEILRQFFEAANREHLLDNTIVIITSDHGESFGEQGFVTHNLHDHGDFEATHHVPLIVVLPPRFTRAAARIDRRVSIANLAATMYDAAGIDWSAFAKRYDGWARSLAPLFITVPPRVARAIPPERSTQDQREAQRERERALKALGYVH
jgi:arylsulfatase A-like enzyme